MTAYAPRYVPPSRWWPCLRNGLDIARRRCASLALVGAVAAGLAWLDMAHGDVVASDALRSAVRQVFTFAIYGLAFRICQADDAIRIEVSAFATFVAEIAVLKIACFGTLDLVAAALASGRPAAGPTEASAVGPLALFVSITTYLFAIFLFVVGFARVQSGDRRACFLFGMRAWDLNYWLFTHAACVGLFVALVGLLLLGKEPRELTAVHVALYLASAFPLTCVYAFAREIAGAGSENRRLTSDFAFEAAPPAAEQPTGG